MQGTIDNAQTRKREEPNQEQHPLIEEQRRKDEALEHPCHAETWEGEKEGGDGDCDSSATKQQATP